MIKNINVVLRGSVQPTGGPSGYLYNLSSSIIHNRINEIKIISPEVAAQRVKRRKKTYLERLIRSLKLKYTPSKIRFNYLIKKERLSYDEFYCQHQGVLEKSYLNNFHGTTDYFYYKHAYPDNNVPTTLMSHTPVVTHLELLEALQDNNYSNSTIEKLVDHQKMIDVYAFENADRIVFPCPEAVSSYDDFIDEHNIDRDKFRYILTQSRPMRFMFSRDDFRNKHGIPHDAIVMAYIGRRNSIKGYDIFCQTILNLRDNQNIVFLTAGGGTIKTPGTSNVIDFGWTDDPGSILNACDCLVVPNRETYFDLGVIQALSLNIPIITTFTGGNRWFDKKNINISFIGDNADALTENVKTFIRSDDVRNKEFFDSNFDSDQFAVNYLSFYNSLIKEEVIKT